MGCVYGHDGQQWEAFPVFANGSSAKVVLCPGNIRTAQLPGAGVISVTPEGGINGIERVAGRWIGAAVADGDIAGGVADELDDGHIRLKGHAAEAMQRAVMIVGVICVRVRLVEFGTAEANRARFEQSI